MPIKLTDYPDVIDFIDSEKFAHLATLMKDGSPQSSPLGLARDGDYIFINSSADTLKVRNLQRDGRVALSIHAPHAPSGFHSYMLLRGTVAEMLEGEEGQKGMFKVMGKITRLTADPTSKESDKEVSQEDIDKMLSDVKSKMKKDDGEKDDKKSASIIPAKQERVSIKIAVNHIHHLLLDKTGKVTSIREEGEKSASIGDSKIADLWKKE